MKAQRIRTVVLAALVVCGCYRERLVTTPQSYLASQQPGKIDLIRADGKEEVVYAPRLVNDTIFGMTGMSQSCMLNRCVGQEMTIGVSQVRSFRVREMDKVKTLGLIGAGAVGLVVMAAALSGHGADMGCVGLCSTNPQTISVSSSSVLPALNLLFGRH